MWKYDLKFFEELREKCQIEIVSNKAKCNLYALLFKNPDNQIENNNYLN